MISADFVIDSSSHLPCRMQTDTDRQTYTQTDYFTHAQLSLAWIILHYYPFNGLFSRTPWVSWHQKVVTILDFNEARDGVAVASAGPWKSFVPHSRQISMPASHHSAFTGLVLFLMPNQQGQSTKGWHG